MTFILEASFLGIFCTVNCNPVKILIVEPKAIPDVLTDDVPREDVKQRAASDVTTSLDVGNQ